MFGRVKSIIGSLVGGAAGAYERRNWRTPPTANKEALLALFNASPELRSIEEAVSSAIGATQWHLRDASGKDVKSDLFARLWRRPNKLMSGTVWRELDQIWLDVLGETFGFFVEDEAGQLEYLPVPPHWVKRADNGDWKVRLGSKRYDIAFGDLIWIKRANPLDPYGRGVGLGQVLADEIESADYAAKHTKAFFYNNATPQLLFMSNTTIDKSKAEEASEAWHAKNRGFAAAWRSAFLSSGWSVTQLTGRFKDLDMSSYRRFIADLVRQTYGVPPEIVGQLNASNRATIQVAEHLFAKQALIPRLRRLRDEYNAQWLPRLGIRNAELVFESPAPADKEFQLAVMQAAPEAFTLNEWRQLASLKKRRSCEGYLASRGDVIDVTDADIIEIAPAGSAAARKMLAEETANLRLIFAPPEVTR